MENQDQSSIDQSESLKIEGNNLFKAQNYSPAVIKYSAAITNMLLLLDNNDLLHTDDNHRKLAIYLSNRAAVHLKMENYGLAINDAEEAINYCSDYPKSYYRKADGLISIDKYKEARNCLRLVVVDMKVKDKDA